MGRDFYDAVASDPEAAVLDAECEEMCYFFAHLYCERFGEFPETGSGISRESCSNTTGWPADPPKHRSRSRRSDSSDLRCRSVPAITRRDRLPGDSPG